MFLVGVDWALLELDAEKQVKNRFVCPDSVGLMLPQPLQDLKVLARRGPKFGGVGTQTGAGMGIVPGKDVYAFSM